MNNLKVTTADLLGIIGRQTVEIELMKVQIEHLQTLVQSEQTRADEAQLLAKRQNGAEKKQAMQAPT